MTKLERRDAVNYVERFLETHEIAYVYEQINYPIISCYDHPINDSDVILINVLKKGEKVF